MIGKKIGKDNIYIHMSAIKELPVHLFARVYHALIIVDDMINEGQLEGGLAPNFIITHPNYIEIVEAENFNDTYEPVLGARYRVEADDETTFIPKPAKPRVLHQRYKTVKPDYCGFDIENDKGREEWYRAHFDARRMAGAGFHHKWMEMLAEIT